MRRSGRCLALPCQYTPTSGNGCSAACRSCFAPPTCRSHQPLAGTVRAFSVFTPTTRSADFCRPVRADRSALSSDSTTNVRSPEVSSTAFRTQLPNLQPTPLMDMDFVVIRQLVQSLPASDPVLVHRLVRLLHASFRPRLAASPLRFAITSPPSGCEKDSRLRAVEQARHTKTSAFRPGGRKALEAAKEKTVSTR